MKASSFSCFLFYFPIFFSEQNGRIGKSASRVLRAINQQNVLKARKGKRALVCKGKFGQNEIIIKVIKSTK